MAKRDAWVTLTSVDRKIGASADRLDKRIDASVEMLDAKVVRLEKEVDRLDHKIDVKSDEAKRHASILFDATKEQM
jgi:hypothetical protein